MNNVLSASAHGAVIEDEIHDLIRQADKEGAFWHRSNQPDHAEATRVLSVIIWPTGGALGSALPQVIERNLDALCSRVLLVPRSDRWRDAVSTALLGDWNRELNHDVDPATALSMLKAEARTHHRHSVPIWRRGTRHGRVLSLDADLGGLSLHDLVAADMDLLTHTTDGAYEDERLNRVLRGLAEAEQKVVRARAAREGTTWTEAAAVTGAPDPVAFGERVRRKVSRLAAEQHRRTAQRRPAPPARVAETAQESLLVGPEPGTGR
ncbi:hypothetical protein [Streptomyces sp. B21-083]|uniref:hypothetical protein n=1 Tax=Streptomyces sp. B21-083 TaxID=3039410 RepID=UPI002FF3DC7B